MLAASGDAQGAVSALLAVGNDETRSGREGKKNKKKKNNTYNNNNNNNAKKTFLLPAAATALAVLPALCSVSPSLYFPEDSAALASLAAAASAELAERGEGALSAEAWEVARRVVAEGRPTPTSSSSSSPSPVRPPPALLAPSLDFLIDSHGPEAARELSDDFGVARELVASRVSAAEERRARELERRSRRAERRAERAEGADALARLARPALAARRAGGGPPPPPPRGPPFAPAAETLFRLPGDRLFAVAAQLGGRGGAPAAAFGGAGNDFSSSSSSPPRPLAVASGSSGLLWLEWDVSGDFSGGHRSTGSESASAEIAPPTHLQQGIGGGESSVPFFIHF